MLEIRREFDSGVIDEVVAENCDVHFEMLGSDLAMLVLEDAEGNRLHIEITSARPNGRQGSNLRLVVIDSDAREGGR